MKFTSYSEWNKYKQFFGDNFTISDEYIICGLGGGFKILRQLFPKLKIKYVLDARSDIECDNYEVYSYDSVEDVGIEKRKFIITPGCEYYSEIKAAIIDKGANPLNIVSFNEILYFWGCKYHDGKFFASACNLILLSSCNLKCKGCSQYVPYIHKSKYISIENVKKTIDNYFKIFDYVVNLMPVGGETLLYKELGEILLYIHDNYSNRYSKINIFTNGIIIPSNELAETMSKIDKLNVVISDYSNVIERKNGNIIEILEKYNIEYTLNNNFGQSSEDLWFDLGNPNVKKKEDLYTITDKFSKCSLICNNIVENRLYYCVPSCFADIGKIHNDILEYYLDLEYLQELNKSDRYDEVGKFLLGFIPEGYLEHCFYCNGYGKDVNKNFVKAGEQA